MNRVYSGAMGRYALLIGVSKFEDPKLGKLNAPPSDVEAFAALLKDPERGAFDEVATCIDRDLQTIKNRLSELLLVNRRTDDTVLLYYSGHGILTKGRKLFLATGHSSFDLPQMWSLSASDLKENYLEASRAQFCFRKCNVAVAVVALILLVFAAFGPRLLSLIHTLLATAHEPSATEIAIQRAVQEAQAAAESGKTGVEFQECDVCPQMVAIPAGSFAMAPGWNGAGGTDPSHVQFLGPSL